MHRDRIPRAQSIETTRSRAEPELGASSRVQLKQRLSRLSMSEQQALLAPEGQTTQAPVQMVKEDGSAGPSPDRQVFESGAPAAAAPKPDAPSGRSRAFGAKAKKSEPSGPLITPLHPVPSERRKDTSVVELGLKDVKAEGEGSATISAGAGKDYTVDDHYSHGRRLVHEAESDPTASDDELLDRATWAAANPKAETGHLGTHRPARPNAKKEGLVVGNADYSRARPTKDLPGAALDAANMEQLYSAPPRKFSVSNRSNLAGGDLQAAIANAGSGLEKGDELLIYFAGHGKEATGALIGADGGEVPVAAAASKASVARSKGFHATIILDSCHSGAIFDEFEVGQEKPRQDRADATPLVPDEKTGKYRPQTDDDLKAVDSSGGDARKPTPAELAAHHAKAAKKK